jgi:hypothetical protein
MLYLAGLDALGSRASPPRPGCYDELAARVPVLSHLYCDDGAHRRHPGVCRDLFKIEHDIDRGGGCGLPEKRAAPPSAFAREGERYLRLAARCAETATLVGVDPLADHCDDDALNAAHAFHYARDPAGIARARALLVDPALKMAKSPRLSELDRLSQ